MGTQVKFILKILIPSVAVSALLKYGGPSLPIAPTPLNALILVLIPTIVLAIALWWRASIAARN
ncbi:MAG: hypothetical protein F6K31_01700 [Symploca sp. SIO2G7]|nr:hypothetical protein [Symploca sp. SIO2G7]